MPFHVRTHGSGSPVVLLHGTPTTTRTFDPLVERLSAHHRVIVPALPGYDGTAPLEHFSLDAIHEGLEDVLREEGPLALVGFSGGVYHAFALASRGRLTVTRLVALAGMANLEPAEADELRGLAALLRAGTIDPASVLPMRMLAASSRARPECLADVMPWGEATSFDNLAAELDAFASAPDLRPALSKLAVSVYVRVGEEDVASPPARSRRIRDACRLSTLDVVPGVGHALFSEDTTRTIAAIKAALQ